MCYHFSENPLHYFYGLTLLLMQPVSLWNDFTNTYAVIMNDRKSSGWAFDVTVQLFLN